MNVRVAVVQLCSGQDVEGNLNAITGFVREAAKLGATFVTLPENALFLRTESGTQAPIEALDGPLMGRVRTIAEDAGVWLLVGAFPEASGPPGRFFNTSVVIDGTQTGAPITATYRKIHLFDVDIPGGITIRESDRMDAGDVVVVADIGGLPVGLTICYDLRFPALYQSLVHDHGARAITVPAAFTEFTGKDHWLPLLKARAIETQSYIIAPNQIGHHGGSRRSYGKSVVFDPWGTPLCIAPDRPSVAVATLDLDYQDKVRQSLPCLAHRRPSVVR